eukprot:1155787-Pelagomonas_calceolata.AAC.1
MNGFGLLDGFDPSSLGWDDFTFGQATQQLNEVGYGQNAVFCAHEHESAMPYHLMVLIMQTEPASTFLRDQDRSDSGNVMQHENIVHMSDAHCLSACLSLFV